MEDRNTQSLANQTEIPVSDLPASDVEKSKFDFIKNIPIKIAAVVLGVIVLIVIGIFVFLNFNTQDNQIAAIIEQADQAYKAGDIDQANQIIDDGLAKYEDNPHLNGAKINLISQQGNSTGKELEAFEASKKLIDKALQKGGANDPNVLNSIGFAYETSGNYSQALDYYEQALNLNPDSSVFWFNKGHVLEFIGDSEGSRSAYEKAYELNKEDPSILIAIGHMRAFAGETHEAFNLYVTASELDGISDQQRAEALTEAAFIRRTQDSYSRLPEAVELSQRAVELSPRFAPALAVHAFNIYLTGETEQAIEFMIRAIEANPRIAKNYFDLAGFYRAKGDFGNAINYYKQAVSVVDTDNTILPVSDRSYFKGRFTYELARTYHLSELQINPTSLIEDAIRLSPEIKDAFTHDVIQNGYYQAYLDDPVFIQLLN